MYNLYDMFDDGLDQYEEGGEALFTEPVDCPPGQKPDGKGGCIPIPKEEQINLYQPDVKVTYSTQSPGANLETEDKSISLWDANNAWVQRRRDQINQLDLDYASTVFTSLNTLPVINGKQISISEFSTKMKDAKIRQAILNQAHKLADSPELDDDTRWKLINNNIQSVMMSGLILEGQRRMQEDLFNAAKIRTAKKESLPYGSDSYLKMFTKDGRLLTKEEWELQRTNDHINMVNDAKMNHNLLHHPVNIKYDKSGLPIIEKPEQKKSNVLYAINLPGSGFNYNKDNEQRLKHSLNHWEDNYKYEDNRSASNYKQHEYYLNHLKHSKSYETMLKAIYDQYNSGEDPANRARKLSADIESKFNNNKGGQKHSPIMEVSFDFAAPTRVADQITDDKTTGGVKFTKGANIPDEGVSDAANLFRIANVYKDQVVIGLGGVKGEVPSESWEKGQQAVQAVIAELQKKHTKGSSLIPKGTLTFQGIVGGETKYHAYTLKMPTFFGHKQFKGKDGLAKTGDELNEEFVNNGITFYVPAEISQGKGGLILGQKFQQASNVSASEGLLNWKNDIDIPIAEGGNIKLVRDPNTGTVTINSYGVLYNPSTKRISDTFRISKNNTFQYDPATNLDAIVKRQIEQIKEAWYFNQKAKREFSNPGSNTPKED